MDKKWTLLFAFVLIAIIVNTLISNKKREVPPPPPTSQYAEEIARRHGPCPGETKTFESEGKKVQVIWNWYECHPLVLGDSVYYRYSFTKEPVVRQIVAVPGDQIEVKKDKTRDGWNLWVNEKLVLDSKKTAVLFGKSSHEPVLSLYEYQNHGKLKPREAIVFSESNAGFLDSGMFGVVNADDFLGKKIDSEIPNAKTQSPHP